MTRIEAHAHYRKVIALAQKDGCLKATLRALDLTDLFYLLVYTLHRKDADNDFVYDRCREVAEDSDDVLDLWCREHYKSTIKTFAGTIQDMIRYPEEPQVIFSCTRPVAKAFLRQVKFELETNELLKELHDDVFWSNPKKDAPKWSEDDGLVNKRKSNPKESGLEAWGLVDGMPTSKHFARLKYDDVETVDMVRTEGMMAKVLEAIQLSFNLATTPCHRTWAGTPYHWAGAYQKLIEQGAVRPRIYAATKDGTETGELWLWTREQLKEKIRNMGPYVSSCQLFINPTQDKMQGFHREWLRYWKADRFTGLNIYILCDPANEKKKDNDWTVFTVVGLGTDKNYYVIRMIRDRLGLVQRANILFALHQQYCPVGVGYEKYGMQADVQHYLDRMERDNYRFSITTLGGAMPKNDRIKQLVPIFSEGRVFIPETCVYQQYDGVTVDLAKHFVEQEYIAFPYPFHDDMLDCLARIVDPDLSAVFPQGNPIDPLQWERPKDEVYDPLMYGLK